MRIIVTGGAGFVGSNLVDELIARGHEVFVIDNLSTGYKKNLNEKADFAKVDIICLECIDGLFKAFEPEYVFHLAALPRIQPSIIDPLSSHNSNVTGTLNVLLCAKKYNVKKVIYAASSSAYGHNKTPYREDMIPNPLNPYAMQKYMGEMYCRLFEMVYGLKSVCCRFFNVYGPRQTSEGAYSTVIGIFLRQNKDGKPMTIVGDGKQTRDFTHVSDIVDGLIKAMESDVSNEVINLGSGRNVSVNYIAELIGGDTVHLPDRPQEARNTRASNKKAYKLLKWKPKVRIEEGIHDLYR